MTVSHNVDVPGASHGEHGAVIQVKKLYPNFSAWPTAISVVEAASHLPVSAEAV